MNRIVTYLESKEVVFHGALVLIILYVPHAGHLFKQLEHLDMSFCGFTVLNWVYGIALAAVIEFIILGSAFGRATLLIIFMLMHLNSFITTQEEVAELIFNSEDAELNDMIRKAKTHNYDINHLIWKITADINGHFESQLRAYPFPSDARRNYLFDRIKSELAYYAH